MNKVKQGIACSVYWTAGHSQDDFPVMCDIEVNLFWLTGTTWCYWLQLFPECISVAQFIKLPQDIHKCPPCTEIWAHKYLQDCQVLMFLLKCRFSHLKTSCAANFLTRNLRMNKACRLGFSNNIGATNQNMWFWRVLITKCSLNSGGTMLILAPKGNETAGGLIILYCCPQADTRGMLASKIYYSIYLALRFLRCSDSAQACTVHILFLRQALW